MNIQLKKLTLTNFKGIRSLAINFTHLTFIYGDNAVGKTTVMDAFLWLLFGKDSFDRKDFEIKTLDPSGRVIEKLEHEVEAVLIVDGRTIELKRVLREKWTKKRGYPEPEFTGNETLYYWNGVPCQLKEYTQRINELVDESIFKLITNPLYFNTTLTWQMRREALIRVAGDVKAEDVLQSFAGTSQYESLKALLNSGKPIADIKRELAARRKKLKDDLQLMPARIDEAQRSMPQPEDYTAIEREIEVKQREIDSIETAMQDVVRAQQQVNNERLKKQNEVYNLTAEIAGIRQHIRHSVSEKSTERQNELAALRNDLRLKQEELRRVQNEIVANNTRHSSLSLELSNLRSSWERVNAESLVFNEADFCCPACKRAFDTSDIESKKEELTTNFNTDKQRRLTAITDRGTVLNKETETLSLRLDELHASEETLVSNIQGLIAHLQDREKTHADLLQSEQQQIETAITTNSEILSRQALIDHLNGVIAAPAEDNTGTLRTQKAGIQQQIDELRRRLVVRDQAARVRQRVAELQAEEKNLANQLAALEGQEYAVEQFTKARIDLLEQRINGLFTHVRFKLFEQQINGGEVECCHTMINGVPFTDANNAARINAGLDIINTLCRFHGVYAPIFVDNRESINRLIDTDSQVVNLIVSDDKQLRVSVEVEEDVLVPSHM